MAFPLNPLLFSLGISSSYFVAHAGFFLTNRLLMVLELRKTKIASHFSLLGPTGPAECLEDTGNKGSGSSLQLFLSLGGDWDKLCRFFSKVITE